MTGCPCEEEDPYNCAVMNWFPFICCCSQCLQNNDQTDPHVYLVSMSEEMAVKLWAIKILPFFFLLCFSGLEAQMAPIVTTTWFHKSWWTLDDSAHL